MRHLKWVGGALLLLLGVAPSTQAGIISVAPNGNSGGDIITDVTDEKYKSNAYGNDIVHGWNEQQNVTLTSNLYIQGNTAGLTYKNDNQLGTVDSRFIAAGTVINSQYLYYDPQNTNSVANVTFTFDSQILGVIIESDVYGPNNDYYLESDYLINPGVQAANIPTTHFDNRGLELGTPNDQISFSGNTVTVVMFGASTPGDQVRVITAGTPVPEPASLTMLGFGAIGLIGYGWRRRSKPAQKVAA